MDNPTCSKCDWQVDSPRDSTRLCCTNPLSGLIQFSTRMSGVTLKNPTKDFPFNFVDGTVATCNHFTEKKGGSEGANVLIPA